jgi:hypothetical protein
VVAGLALVVAIGGLTTQMAGGHQSPTDDSTPGVRVLPRTFHPSDAAIARVVTYQLSATPPAPPSIAPLAAVSGLAANGIPLTAFNAYVAAAAQQVLANPACGLTWPLLAAIGRVESDHGRAGGAVLRVDGTSSPRTIGPALNGVGTALIPATVGGQQMDGDPRFDHALGPMQIIPNTWLTYRTAASGHTTADPFNIFDAAATAARYLCAAAGAVNSPAGAQMAVTAYNHSPAYVATVLAIETIYAAGGSAATLPAVTGAPAPAPTSSAPATSAHPSLKPSASASPSVCATPTPTATGSSSGSDSTTPTVTPTPTPTPNPTSTPTPTPTPTPSASATNDPTVGPTSSPRTPGCPS